MTISKPIAPLKKLMSITLVMLLICTVAIPVSANETPENLNIDDMQENFYKSQSKNPSKILRTTDGKLFLINSENEERPEYFNWINDNDEFEVVFDENDNPLILIPIPYEHRPRITDSCWPFPCVQAPLPIIAIGGLYITLESIEILTATTVVAASIASTTTINMAEAFRVTNNIFKKGCNEFQRISIFLTSYLNGSHLSEYNFYYLYEPGGNIDPNTLNKQQTTNNCLDDHVFYGLKKGYVERNQLTSVEALELMKDCNPKPEKAIWIGSTEEGCRELANIATILLGGKGITIHEANHKQPMHTHANPPDENGKHRHCKPHCFWDYDNFFGNSKGGNPA